MKRSGGNQDCGLRTILITGGCGFIGVNLTKFLSERGFTVRIVDNLSVGKKEYMETLFLPEPPEFIIQDIRNKEAMVKAVDGMEAVVHLAAHTSVVESVENPEEDWDINVNGTLNLLEACRRNGVDKFVFASSNAVVGEQDPPIDETKVPQPISPYGASKLAGEALCSAYYHSFGLKTISLRFANCYGPYLDHKISVVSRFMRWAKEEKPLVIYGDGSQTRDFIHVYDVCQAIHLALMARNSAFGEVFQIASGTETAISKLTQLVREVTERNLQIIYEPERRGEIRRNYSDISKAKRMLEFEPKVNLEEGLSQLWHAYIPK